MGGIRFSIGGKLEELFYVQKIMCGTFCSACCIASNLENQKPVDNSSEKLCEHEMQINTLCIVDTRSSLTCVVLETCRMVLNTL